jgi:protein-S-isoprenylcysteine O-methyltransferase Ste14
VWSRQKNVMCAVEKSGVKYWALVLGETSALIAFGILFAFRIQAEEAMMLETFGADYSAYMTKTKRLVPAVW